MKREAVGLWSEALGATGTIIRYGHWGSPVLAFPPEQGLATDFEDHGVVAAVAGLIESGRLKVYCVDGHYAAARASDAIAVEERVRRYGRYGSWIIDDVVPWIHEDCGSEAEIATLGVSAGAYHAAGFALRRADLFPLAMCFSGTYDPGWWPGESRDPAARGDPGAGRSPGESQGPGPDERTASTPLDFIGTLERDRLEWLRGRVSLLLVCGQGSQEEASGALRSTRRFADALAGRGIRHELDLWGPRVQHDWPAWRTQVAHHLPRFC